MILETLVATADAEGRLNVAPMGITLAADRILLRPFQEARTCSNLREVGEGVVNFTDDVLLFARCALGHDVPEHRPAERVRGAILAAACHWKEFIVEASDLGEPRGRFSARVVAEGRARDFLGFNRGKHAVIEATILATRLFLLGRDAVVAEIDRLQPLVEKTGGEQERAAFDFVRRHVAEGAGAAPGADPRGRGHAR